MGKKPDIPPPNKIKLVQLPRALISNGISGVTYAQCYNAAVGGQIPMEQTPTGRWVLDSDKLPSVIKHFSLLKEEPNGQSQDS